jgi:hypothetical protein
MTKLLATCAAATLTAAFALPASAETTKRPDGVRNVDQTEVSDQRRRHRRYVHRYYAPRYGYARPYYYDAPYYAYAPAPYYRPYYRPGVSVGVGPFGFGLGF